MIEDKISDDLVMNLVDEALARPEAERETFLRDACAPDSHLFEETLDLVRMEERMAGFLLEPLLPRFETERPFRPEQLLAGRFRVVREIGEGGMGIVYEAFDNKLSRTIAIKCAKPGFQRHLPPEARNATDINHSNVCKVYDIHTESTPYGHVDFLTMQYLEGDTLSDRIRREGRLPAEQVREIALQLCGGLDAAHRSGIIHGDLKSNNIILTEEPGGRLKALITDFGLARSTAGSAGADFQGGARAYMAPEMLRGQRSSVSSDLYALGVILYEALTGQRPSAGGSGWNSSRSTLSLPSEQTTVRKVTPASRLGIRVDAGLDQIILRCLDSSPERRPASAVAIAATISPAGRRVAPAVAALAGAILMFLPGGNPVHQAADPVRLALLPFHASATETAIADGSLSETGELLGKTKSFGRSFTVIPVKESKAMVDDPSRARVALGATHVLTGTWERQGGRVIIHAKVLETRSRQATRQSDFEYDGSEISRVPVALAGMVTSSFSLRPVAAAETIGAAAYSNYAAGLAHLQTDSEADAAIASLERAAGAAHDSALVQAALARAYRLKYKITGDSHYRNLAIAAATAAGGLNSDSTPVHMITGLLRLDAGQYAKAAQDFKRATELEPNGPEAYFWLARVYERMDRPVEAIAALRNAIRLQPGYFRAHEELGAFYYDRGQYEESAAEFREVTRLVPGIPDGHSELAAPYLKLGKYAEAESELRTALGFRKTADALVTLGAVLYYQARYAEALPFYKEAASLAPKLYLPRQNLGDVYRWMRDIRASREAYQHALALTQTDVSRNPQDFFARANMAYVLARLGRREEARYEIGQALATPSADAQAVQLAALTYEALGERGEALSVLKEAPSALFPEIERHPDLADLCRDPRFAQLLSGGRF